MRRTPRAIAHATVCLTVLGTGGVAMGADAAVPAGPVRTARTSTADAVTELRSFATAGVGLRRPSGLAWDATTRRLVITGAAGAAGTEVLAMTPAQARRATVGLPWARPDDAVAIDPTDGSVDAIAGSSIRSAPSLRSSAAKVRTSAGRTELRAPAAATYDASGDLVVLDASQTLVRMTADDRVIRTPVDGAAGHDLRGIAASPDSALVHTYDATAGEMLGVGRDGRIRARYDASGLDLTNVRGLAFAPSADATDDPSTTSLFIADAGTGAVTGQITEATLDDASVTALAASGTLVRTTATSAYNPPSPDPSGIAYLPGPDRLFIADGEVNEMSIFQNRNLWRVTRTGTVDDTGVSLPWSEEPVGVGYNPGNNHLLVSDDDEKEVFDVAPGGDGRYGTADDTVTHFDTAGFGNTDPEGLDYDSATNSIWLVDGVNREVYRVRPGPDGQFGNSDDVRSHFDVGVYGARDPEGLGYDAVRDTIVIVDDGSDTIYELDKSGALLNTVSTSSASMVAAAGLAVAPGSTNPSTRTYYVVARGEDNDSHPNENDGRMYELSASLPPVGDTNQPPQVSSGADQTVIRPASATLDATVTDDGRPTPPGAVTTTWSEVSGPGTVTFGNPAAVDTTATFSTDGSYVLRLTATDGQATTADDVTVLVLPEGSPNAVEVRVAAGTDDAEQAVSGSTALTSSDLELTADGSTQQVVGTRFTGLQIPAGATITNAYVQFRTDEVSTGVASLTIRGEAHDSAPTYQAVSGNVTSRPVTTASVAWTPPAWNTVGEVGAAQRTPDVSAVVQAVVDRPGWAAGNAMALQFSGTGRRTAEAYESGAAFAPLLHVEYSTGPVANRAPSVNAGPDQTVVLPNAAGLDGSVTDDGLPGGSSVATTWSVVSGPGTVSFGDSNVVDTTATFSVDGSYVLRLTASDGELTSSDQTTITVQPTGTTQTIDIRAAAGASDAEQAVTGSTALTSSDLELTTDGNTQQVVGTRFAGLQIPGGATITNAYVQFRTDEVSTDAAALTIRAEASDNAATYQAVSGNITSRAVTAASVSWTPPAWNTVGQAVAAQRTPDVSALVQAVVDRPGWTAGNALAVQFSGTGRRTAEAYEGGASFAPLLHVEYSTGPVTNRAPGVNAGPDQTVILPASAALDATVIDDGLPSPPGTVTTTWSKVSGPGTVTFGDPNAVDTSATFSTDGSYELRLTATDGELTSSDQTTITAQPTGTTGLPAAIAGISPEAHGHLGPFRDGNGYLYTFTESTLADGNRIKAMRSSDGGRTWVEVDAANRPTTSDFEAGWAVQQGTTLHLLHQKAPRVSYHTFNTSDAPSNPDQWVIKDEVAADPGGEPTDQWVSLTVLGNGDVWAFYGLSVNSVDRIGYKKRTGGAWSTESILDASVATTQAVTVRGANDKTHIFYKDNTNGQLLHRSLTSEGILSAAERVDDTGTQLENSPITNAIYYDDDGVETVVVAWADGSAILKSARVLNDGTPTNPLSVSASPVLMDPGITANRAAVAQLALDGKTVHAVWADSATADVFHDTNTDDLGWGGDTEIRDAVTAHWLYASVFSHSPANGSAKVLGYIYDNNTDNEPDTEGIEFHELVLPSG